MDVFYVGGLTRARRLHAARMELSKLSGSEALAAVGERCPSVFLTGCFGGVLERRRFRKVGLRFAALSPRAAAGAFPSASSPRAAAGAVPSAPLVRCGVLVRLTAWPPVGSPKRLHAGGKSGFNSSPSVEGVAGAGTPAGPVPSSSRSRGRRLRLRRCMSFDLSVSLLKRPRLKYKQ